jgi:hypothetical protein
MPPLDERSGPEGPPRTDRRRKQSPGIVPDARDRRRARTVRRMAAIELVALHYGAIPAAQWCTFCHGECRMVSA